ncbi:MAG: hypothetical protein Q8M02_12685 [Candidatus Didemnitutus sp.]|nr:hypothetical protein [Candidatus Didemnitutus sp.]
MKNPTFTAVALITLLVALVGLSLFLPTDTISEQPLATDLSRDARSETQGRETGVAETSKIQHQQGKLREEPFATSTAEQIDWNSADVRTLVNTLGTSFRGNPQLTLDLMVQRVSDPSKRETLEMALFSDWAATDPLAAIAAARSCRFRSSDLLDVSPVRIALNQWATSSPAEAAEWLVKSPWYSEFAKDYRKSVEAVFIAWGRQGPDRGLDWLAKHHGQLGQSSSSAITSLSLSTAVYGKDFVTASDIAQLLPESEKRTELLRRIAELEQQH